MLQDLPTSKSITINGRRYYMNVAHGMLVTQVTAVVHQYIGEVDDADEVPRVCLNSTLTITSVRARQCRGD